MLHQAHSTTGQVGVALRQLGHRVQVVRPLIGQSMPRQICRFDGVIVFGGITGRSWLLYTSKNFLDTFGADNSGLVVTNWYRPFKTMSGSELIVAFEFKSFILAASNLTAIT